MDRRAVWFCPSVVALVALMAIPACECPTPGAVVQIRRERPLRGVFTVAERERSNCTTVALPTGAENSSVLEVQKCGPSSVRANEPFNYTISVRNLRDDVELRNVVIHDEIADALKVQSSDAPAGAIDRDLGPRTEALRPRVLQRVADPAADDLSMEDLKGEPKGYGDPNLIDDDAILDDEDEPRDEALLEGMPFRDEPGMAPKERQVINVEYEDRHEFTGTEPEFHGDFMLVSNDGKTFERQGNVLTFEIGHLGPKQVWNVSYTATAIADGTFDNCVTANYEVFGCLATNVTAPELKLTAAGPGEFTICSNNETQVHFTLTNVGTGTAKNVRIDTTLSPGLEIVDQRFASPKDVGAGETWECTATVRVLKGGDHTITATAVSEDGLTAEANDVTFYARKGRIALRAVGPEMEYIGVPLDYQVEVINEGDAPAGDATVEFNLPTAMQVVDPGDRCKVEKSAATFNIGTIPPGESRPLRVSLKNDMREPRTIRTVVSANAICSGSDSVVVRTRLEGIPALLVEAVDNFDPRKVGQSEEYEVIITNQGSAAETNVTLTAELPREMTFERSSGPTEPRIEGNVIYFAPLPVLAPGTKQTWKITAMCNEPGDVRFQIRVDSDQHGLPVRETEATRIYTTTKQEGIREGDLPPDMEGDRPLPPPDRFEDRPPGGPDMDRALPPPDEDRPIPPPDREPPNP